LLWAQSFTTGALYDDLPDGALVNHFPNTVAITHKHRLVLNLRRLRDVKCRETNADADADADGRFTSTRRRDDRDGKIVFANAPVGFLLPAETRLFLAADRADRDALDADAPASRHRPQMRWIVKRSVGGEGRGIAVCADASSVLERVKADVAGRNAGQARLDPLALPLTARRGGSGTSRKRDDEASSGEASSDEASSDASHVVQRYVPRPVRVFGRKVDLRVYALVTCWGGPAVPTEAADETRDARPEIRAYVYGEGLVRFAASEYDAFDDDPKRHLTNNALASGREHQTNFCADANGAVADGAVAGERMERNAPAFEGPSAEAHFKRNWSFSRFSAHLDQTRGGGSWGTVWEQTRAIARGAIEAAQPAVRRGLAAVASKCGPGKVAPRRRHFELLGLDVLIDEDLTVWLLEVNGAPSLTAGTRNRGRVSETHHALKGGLIADALNLVNAAKAQDSFRSRDAENETEKRDREAREELRRAKTGRFVSLYAPGET
jgi:hypothetical protein